MLHVGYIFGHFPSVLVLLLDDCLNARLYICLVIAIAHS